MLWEHNDPEGSLTERAQRLVLLNVVFWVKALCLLYRIVPIYLLFRTREENRTLLSGRAYQQQAMLCLLVFSKVADLCSMLRKALFIAVLFCNIYILWWWKVRWLWCLSLPLQDTLERTQTVIELRLFCTFWSAKNQMRLWQWHLVLFEPVWPRFEVAAVHRSSCSFLIWLYLRNQIFLEFNDIILQVLFLERFFLHLQWRCLF